MTGPRPYPTLPVLLGMNDGTGEALASIVHSIGTLVKPNAEYQHALRALFTEKPELMQKFVDIEKANPGTLKAFGFGDAGSDMLSRMQESIPGLVTRTTQPDIATELGKRDSAARGSAVTQAISGQTPGQLSTDELTAMTVKAAREMFKDDPEAQNRYIRARLQIGTELDQTLDQQALQNVKNIDELVGKGVPELMTMISNGRINAEIISAGLSNPRTAPAMKIAVAQIEQDRNYDANWRLAQARVGNDDALTRMKLSAAQRAWERSGKRGSVGGWYAYMNNGDTTFGAPAPGEAALINEAVKDEGLRYALEQSQRVYKAVEPTITKLRTTKGRRNWSSEEVQADIDRLNMTFKEMASPWRARWIDDAHWYSRNNSHLVFENGGMVTDDPTALLGDTAPSGSRTIQEIFGAQLTPEEQATRAMLQNLTPEARQQYYDSLNPASAAKLRGYFGDDE